MNYTNISYENSVKRIDAEYFKKKYLKEDTFRNKYSNLYLGNVAFITDGQHGYHEVDNNSNIRHLTAKNFKNWFANDIDADRLAQWVEDSNKRSSLKKNDIVLTTRGTVGFCAIVKENVLPANIDQDVARIFLNDCVEILPQYLLAYINSKFGQDWTVRNQTGMVQQGLALWRIKEFPIPQLSLKLQEIIKEIVELSFDKNTLSTFSHHEAEKLLLETVGLQNFEPNKESVNIKSFKNSFLESGRLDAEYYQKKYEEVFDIVKINGFYSLNELFNIFSNPSPSSYTSVGTKVIKTKNIRTPTIDADNITDHTNLATTLIQKNDLLFASMGVGSLGRISYIDKEIDNYTTDGTIRIFRAKKEFQNQNIEIPVMLFLTSKFGQELIYKYVIGSTGIISISKENVENLVIPKISVIDAQRLTDLVLKSQSLKAESERLLKVAKQAVEMAIEEDEEKAIAYINSSI